MERLDVVVLAGGFAKRMWPLTKDKPKQLLPLAGKPMLAYVLEKLEPLADTDQLGTVYISTNQAFADQLRKYLSSYSGSQGQDPYGDGWSYHWTAAGLGDLRLVIEPAQEEGQKLGSLGALGQLFELQGLKGPLLILGSDNLYDFPLSPLTQAHAETGLDVVGFFDVEDLELAKLYGIAALNERGHIAQFVEKPADPPSTLAATALWLLSEEGVQALRDYLAAGHNRDALGNFLAWRIDNAEVMGHAYKGTWYDIGSLESYDAACKWLEG